MIREHNGVLSNPGVLVILGIIFGFADYSLNRYARVPLVELLVFLYLFFMNIRLTDRQRTVVGALVCAVMVSKVLVGDAIDGLVAAGKMLLLLCNMFFVFNFSLVNNRFLNLFFGVAVAFALEGTMLVFVGEVLDAKFIFPNFVPVAAYLITQEPISKKLKIYGAILMVWQVLADYVIEFRSQLIIVGVMLFGLVSPRSILVSFVRNLYLLPLLYVVGATVFINSDNFVYDKEYLTKSNIERSVLSLYAYERFMEFPLVGVSNDEFLHKIDLSLGGFTTDELSTTSAHNIYADFVIQYGLPVTLLLMYVLFNFCKWASVITARSRKPLVMFSSVFSMFMIFSLTPVSAHLRIELIWLVGIMAASMRLGDK